MSQPPYPPQGDAEPGGDRSGAHGWNSPGDDEPTRRFAAPYGEGQRNATQQFGTSGPVPPEQAPYTAPGYGQPSYGQTPYGQPPYGQVQYPQPQYGHGQYGGPQYGQAQYGQAQYGQPPYGQPQWAAPGVPGPPKNNRTTVIALTVGGILVLAVVVAALFSAVRSAGGSSSSGGDGIPEAMVTPDGLGDDDFLDALAQECFAGDMQACDDLYLEAEPDSRYGVYGGTCAGRQDVSDADVFFCADAFSED